MSASSSATVQGSRADAIICLEDRTLRIELQDDFRHKLGSKAVTLGGAPPEEAPRPSRQLHLSGDVRSLCAYALRFKSLEPHDLLDEGRLQEGIKSAIWAIIRDLLAEEGLESDLPRISFDVHESDDEVFGLVDLVFSSSEAFAHIRWCFRNISIGGMRDQGHLYRRIGYTNSVGGDVLKIDCINMSLDDGSDDSLYLALSDMTSKIGSLLGVAKIVSTIDGGIQEVFTGTIRCFVKLTNYWRAAPLSDLIERLPTFLKWQGVPHRLQYAGVGLHEEAVHSADYPLDTAGPSSEPLAGTSATQTANESGGASKKRKAGGG